MSSTRNKVIFVSYAHQYMRAFRGKRERGVSQIICEDFQLRRHGTTRAPSGHLRPPVHPPLLRQTNRLWGRKPLPGMTRLNTRTGTQSKAFRFRSFLYLPGAFDRQQNGMGLHSKLTFVPYLLPSLRASYFDDYML